MTSRRNTKQLEAIRTAIMEAGRPLSIEEIHAAASDAVPSLGIRTVYRTIRRLQEDEEVANVPVPGSADRYEPAAVASHHHHHFHCRICDRFYDIEGCPGGLSKMLPNGFQLESHELTLSGRCAACA
ncbi:MAG: transcriptional repressor [Phycisphaerae bacterium]|nr:transcriptional repressor [Phycisphaerae bacterium]MAH67112.1 transcriptional repressor [Phycisphaerae bacterium]OUX03417.1 MAG: transcriptional repressor [Phycisphaeraceae bacterium TMED231]